MAKKRIEDISKALPDFFKNAIDYLKNNFDEKGGKVLENTGGTIGVLVNLFAQPMIDKYFNNLSEKKLENFGLNVYIKSGLIQANESLDQIMDKLDNTIAPALVFDALDRSVKEEISHFSKEDVLLIYQPQYHPAVVFIKNSYSQMLRKINAGVADIKAFVKHFNENIEAAIIKEFGDDYEKHLKNIDKFRLQENETRFLWDTIQQAKIGFKDTEDLKYETSYGAWKSVGDLKKHDEEKEDNDDDDSTGEGKNKVPLKPLETLIEEYFDRDKKNSIEDILFLIADFGKGKSVFLRHYAAGLARNYLQTKEGYFPVYFNLRNFKNYSSDHRLGVISDYLETRYSIKIEDEYFRKKKYVFLVDSLDESGELTKRAIDKVIVSVKGIQSINKSLYRTNRIIITSRPFDDGLISHLKEHNPYVIQNNEGRDVPCFIDVHGFTKTQFNTWLFGALQSSPGLDQIKATGFAEKLLKAVKNSRELDVYAELLKNKTLSKSELTRPIFAYMIYQLIINNVDFLAVGKIGVYLSFLNLLTKEAKHILDANYKVNLKEEFEFRNILHTTAALWMSERQTGKQSVLKKADICRALEGERTGETDNEVLERFKGQGLVEIQFLSHSYFGENDNTLYFQHQSFAEILLAEYYLKVFIKYAWDENADPEEARIKLILGEPTGQTIVFFKEMLQLLRDTAVKEETDAVIEKRKLLFPLLASLATSKHNRLFCHDLYYSWFKHCDIRENQTEFPQESLRNWCVDDRRLTKIVTLSASMLNSHNSYLPVRGTPKIALFNADVLALQNQAVSGVTPNIEQWLALLVGNTLYNDRSNSARPRLFNWDFEVNFNQLFEMIRSWNYAFNDSSPSWGLDLFQGINMQDNNSRLNLSHYDFDGINFSYSYFCDLECWYANWSRCTLDHCSFEKIAFITSRFVGASIRHIKKIEMPFVMRNCDVGQYLKLLDALDIKDMIEKRNYDRYKGRRYLTRYDIGRPGEVFKTLEGLFKFGLEQSFLSISYIKQIFQYDSEETRKKFYKKLDALKKYEVISEVTDEVKLEIDNWFGLWG